MSGQIVPISKVELSFRLGTLADVPFMDSLQKLHGRGLGFFSTKQFEGYVEMDGVLVAEANGSPVGYCISRDRYLKRDELGVIYQLCVTPGMQRGYVGAALVREVFERSAYGCRLYCCWCAKDLDANYFWESMGFVPVAFRAGSDKKRRVHIFWQKRIVEGDVETKWWYPSQTTGGAIRADRLVFPIPPGTRWQDVEAVKLPGTDEAPKLEGPKAPRARKTAKPVAPAKVGPLCGGLMFAPATELSSERALAKIENKSREKAPKQKINPKLVAAARELRDRWMEQVNAGAYVLEDAGKYDVARQRHLSATASAHVIPLLPAA